MRMCVGSHKKKAGWCRVKHLFYLDLQHLYIYNQNLKRKKKQRKKFIFFLCNLRSECKGVCIECEVE